VQIGRTANAASSNADNFSFDNFRVSGNCALAGLYNFSSEDSTFFHPIISNGYVPASGIASASYAAIEDGYNHFNAYSPFVTVTAPLDTAQSMAENIFDNGTLTVTGGGIPLWTGNVSHFRTRNSYALNTNSALPYCVVLYNETGNQNRLLDYDIHCENTTLTDIFFITGNGTATSPTYLGFRYADQAVNASNSILKTDSGYTNVALNDVTFELATATGLTGILATPGAFTTSTGLLYFGPTLPASNWNTFTGPRIAPNTWTWLGAITYTGLITQNNSIKVGQHVGGFGTSPTLSACGSPNGSVSTGASDLNGTVTEGTTNTGCNINFNTAYTNAPDCILSPLSSSYITSYSTTTTSLIVVNNTNTGFKFTYHCMAQ
jgi:hypothetical protein